MRRSRANESTSANVALDEKPESVVAFLPVKSEARAQSLALRDGTQTRTQ
jgi:hypothetical protein